jgi:plastocyanin
MTNHQPRSIPAEAMRRLQSEALSRRTALRLLGAVGLTATGISTVRSVAGQEASPEAGAMATGTMATPTLGERPDGSRVWRVLVAANNDAELLEFMTFFPRELTINAGDTIFFDFQGHHAPHTVTFLSGAEAPPLLVPASEGATPAAGQPPELMFNPAAAFPAGGNTYDGTGVLNSGLNVLFPPDQTFTVTFTAPGSFDYLCLVHPVMMKGTVTVQEQGAAVPYEQADIDSMVVEHMAQLTEDGKALIAEYTNSATPMAGSAGGNVWDVRAGTEGDEVAVLRYMPDNVTIAAGDTVRWTVDSKFEPHTVTFLGGEEPPDLIEPQMQEGGPPKLVFNPDIVGRVGPEVYSGQGYANSGAMGADFQVYTGLSTYELTFDTPGEYPYYCALHGSPTMGMRAKVTVT